MTDLARREPKSIRVRLGCGTSGNEDRVQRRFLVAARDIGSGREHEVDHVGSFGHRQRAVRAAGSGLGRTHDNHTVRKTQRASACNVPDSLRQAASPGRAVAA
jgi:hypothetical protein